MIRPQRHDVAVVGAGPAGCATALELRRHGVESVVVFRTRGRPFPVGESIPPDTRMLLERLGVWDGFTAAGHEPCLGSCSAWGSEHLGYNDFLFNPYGNGWHLDRDRFDDDVVQRVAEVGARVVESRINAVEQTPNGGFRLQAADAIREARFVVDATGAAARIARSLDAKRQTHDRLSCMVGFFDVAPGTAMTRLTMLEAVAAGWWYAARLPGERAVALMASDADIIKEHQLDTEPGWLGALRTTQHIGPSLDGATLIRGSLKMRSAPSGLTEPSAGEGWLAVGDAAASFDPLSSQGIYQALAGGLDAGSAIAAWLDGDSTGVSSYADAVQSRFDEYLANRSYLYGLEHRWESAPFWVRRRARNGPDRRIEITVPLDTFPAPVVDPGKHFHVPDD